MKLRTISTIVKSGLADRRRGRRRPAAPWAALILVVGVNCALYSLLQSKKEAARLDASLDATVAWRERALAAEETVAALAERQVRYALSERVTTCETGLQFSCNRRAPTS